MICLGIGLILILICLTVVCIYTSVLMFKVKDYAFGMIFLMFSVIEIISLIIFTPLIIMSAIVVIFR